MRGDRPAAAGLGGVVSVAPPHARGSTPSDSAPIRNRVGSPAWAGIDVSATEISLLKKWLPRMRGDRPWRLTTATTSRKAPPHARGSTAHPH